MNVRLLLDENLSPRLKVALLRYNPAIDVLHGFRFELHGGGVAGADHRVCTGGTGRRADIRPDT